MKNTRAILVPLTMISLAVCLGLSACNNRAQEANTVSPASQTQTPSATQTSAQTDAAGQWRETKQQARPDIEQRRKEAQQQAESTLDKDAIAAVDETHKALRAITENKNDEALAAIERATDKINTLLARNSAAALIPVASDVDVIDAAPLDIPSIKKRAADVATAVSIKDFPDARVLLFGMTSEIHTRTYHLPLATYPAALTQAAKLLDQKNNKEAATVLLTALNTLLAIDLVTPIPVVLAQAAIDAAQAIRDTDKAGAQKLLDVARHELDRSRELGYLGNDPEYAALDKDIADLLKQLQGSTDTSSVFSKLKERVASFFKRLSQREQR